MDTEVNRVLILDDTPGRHTLLPTSGDTVFTIRHPLDLDAADLIGIDLVCVDEYLGDEWALEVNNLVGGLPTLMNNDGLAVAAALRSRARLAAQDGESGFAVALFTAELDKLAQGTPRSRQEPLTASLHDLEWVFRFEDGPAPLGDRISELAAATRSLASIDVATSGDAWLGLRSQPWADLARAQVDDCRPPEHALARSTSGRSYLRWLAQRILPYPAFLLDDAYAASLLGIDVDSFRSPAIQEFLAQYEAQYRGALASSFLGIRWWRAALQHLLQGIGSSQWDTSEEKARSLALAADATVVPLRADNPVITYDVIGEVAQIGAEAEKSVRVQMDGWPVYADEAWAGLDDARADPALRSLVAHDDLGRLES
jgi:hypothetical protein